MTVLDLSFETVSKPDLSTLQKYVEGHDNAKYFDEAPGKEHYRLLASISSQLPDGSVMYDIGTYLGYSAVAMSYNPNVKVVTYDIANFVKNQSIKDIKNIERRLGNCIMDVKDIVNDTQVVMIDVDPHDGVQEIQMLNAFVNAGFKGMMLFDDIYANREMTNFWNSIDIEGTRKIDATNIGHWSGTGILLWDNCGIECTWA